MQIFSLILLMSCTPSFAQDGVQILQRETVLELDWGKKSDEIGLGRGEMVYGPDSFLVDKNGTVYILDTMNQRMSVFNNENELVRNFPITGTGETCWDEDGDILLNDAIHQVILKYSTDGTLLEMMCYELKSYVAPLTKWNGDMYMFDYKMSPFNSFHENSTGLTISRLRVTKVSKEESPRFIGTYSNNKYISENNRYYVILPDGRKQALFDSKGFVPGDLTMYLQEDSHGYIYFNNLRIIDRKNRNADIRELFVLNSNFNLIAKIENLPLSRYTEAAKELFITETGIIYQMHTDSSGVNIYKWDVN